MTTQISTLLMLSRKWWWSPLPPWSYQANNIGWGRLEEPGIFNLVWAAAAVDKPPADYRDPVLRDRIMWVLCDAPNIKVANDTLPNWAHALALPEFETMLVNHKKELDRWSFSDGDVNSNSVIKSIRNARQRQQA